MIHYFRKRWLPALFLIIFSIVFPNTIFPLAAQSNFRLQAQSAILMDALSGQVLYEKNARLRLSPASFAKILTLYLAFDTFRNGHLKIDDWVIVSRRAWKMGGSKMFLRIGEKVRVEDLLRGVTIVSGNDACIALAQYISVSENAFVLEMNKKAKLLGLNHSQFKNSHGMPAQGQYTTAFDMAILAQHYIKDHPEALPYHSITEFEYNGIRQQNRNTLLRKNLGVDGLMTGHVEESGYHLMATAKRDGQRMIAVMMGCDGKQQRTQEAQKLLEFGFKDFSTLEAVKKDSLFGPEKVVGGKLNKVHLVPAEAGWVTVVKGNENSISITSEVAKPITAPIQKGQVAGKVVIQSEGKVLKEIGLFFSSDVPKGIYLPWPIIGGAIFTLILVSLIMFWLIRRSKGKKFL